MTDLLRSYAQQVSSAIQEANVDVLVGLIALPVLPKLKIPQSMIPLIESAKGKNITLVCRQNLPRDDNLVAMVSSRMQALVSLESRNFVEGWLVGWGSCVYE